MWKRETKPSQIYFWLDEYIRFYPFEIDYTRRISCVPSFSPKASLTGRNNSAPAWCEIISDREGFRERSRGSSIITRNDYASDSAFIGVSKSRCSSSLFFSLELSARRARCRVREDKDQLRRNDYTFTRGRRAREKTDAFVRIHTRDRFNIKSAAFRDNSTSSNYPSHLLETRWFLFRTRAARNDPHAACIRGVPGAVRRGGAQGATVCICWKRKIAAGLFTCGVCRKLSSESRKRSSAGSTGAKEL